MERGGSRFAGGKRNRTVSKTSASIKKKKTRNQGPQTEEIKSVHARKASSRKKFQPRRRNTRKIHGGYDRRASTTRNASGRNSTMYCFSEKKEKIFFGTKKNSRLSEKKRSGVSEIK